MYIYLEKITINNAINVNVQIVQYIHTNQIMHTYARNNVNSDLQKVLKMLSFLTISEHTALILQEQKY